MTSLIAAAFTALSALCSGADTNRVIRSASELHDVVFGTATVGARFELEAEVTFPRRTRCESFAIFDDTGYTLLKEHRRRKERAANPIFAGDHVRISGVTRRHKLGGVHAAVQSVRIISKGKPQPPADIKAADFIAGRFDCRLVRMEGLIRDAFRDEIDPTVIFFVIESDGETIYATLSTKESDDSAFRHFVGAEVSVVAISHLETMGSRRLMGRVLSIECVDDIRITKTPVKDPFAVPDICIPGQPQIQKMTTLGRRRATGHVIATWRGNNLLLKTAEKRIMRVELAEGAYPRNGQYIESAGIPATDFYNMNLTRAIWRPAGNVPFEEDAPTNITATAIMTDEQGRTCIDFGFHGRAIRLQGIVRSQLTGTEDYGRLYLECEKYIVPVDLSSCREPLDDVVSGCRVSVTGICVMDIENWNPNSGFPRVKGFTVVARTPSDVRIESRPAWWTPGRLMAVIGALLAALAAIFLWNRSLNRLAEVRGRELAEESEAHITSEMKVRERTRLAIELHDALSQNLTGVSLEIETAAKLAAKPHSSETSSATIRHLDIAARSLKSCRDELRDCIWDLRNYALEESDMNDAVRRTLAPYIVGTNLVVRFNVSRECLPENTAHSLLRIIRELVQNAIRHGHAKTVKVAGCIDGDRLLFSVEDDGCGFDTENCPGVQQGHFGLQGIRERVRHLCGEMSIRSGAGDGTKATIAIPAPRHSTAKKETE